MTEDTQIKLCIPSVPQRLAEVVTSIALLNFLFLAGTWFWLTYYRSVATMGWDGLPAYKYFASQLDLGNENVLASWYSSMLIFLLAIMSFICFIADLKKHQSQRDFYLCFGWLVFTVIFTFLSFDELGSFHERIGILYSLESVGKGSALWSSLVKLVVGMMAGAFSLWGWIVTRRYPYVLKLMILGVLLLLCVQVFESIEPVIWQPGLGQEEIDKPLTFTLFEEGSEICSWLSCCSAFGVYAIFALRKSGDRQQASCDLEVIIPLKTGLHIVGRGVLILGLGMMLIQMMGLEGIAGDDGIPENWFPSVLAIITSLVCVQLWHSMPPQRRLQGWLYLGVGAFSLLMSAYYGAGMPGWRSDIWGHSRQVGLMLDGSLSAIALLLGALIAIQVKTRWSQVAAIAWAILLSLAIFGVGRYYKSGLVDFAAFAVLLPSLLTHLPHYGVSTATDAQKQEQDSLTLLPSQTENLPYL
ncbi:MAG: hypothetical protein IGR80_00825 [Synechococcales cyanobacterium K44_A2020_017]|nr:hypothetical protein [Synechococcales cyanobacterium K32_A2020_035]MBF2093287.1 hypothetical protein [Synechococcales cyanobacterium K44_A2020_017]